MVEEFFFVCLFVCLCVVLICFKRNVYVYYIPRFNSDDTGAEPTVPGDEPGRLY